MQHITFKNSINDGIIISTTGFPKNSNPRQYPINWAKGSSHIVGMIEKVIHTTSTQKTFSQHTPFKPQYVFSFSDEQFILSSQPMQLFWAVNAYQDWVFNDCKGQAPEFKEVVDTLCTGNLSIMIGLGGYIFCELDSDAQALINYYQI